MFTATATVMNYKDEDIEMLEENNSQNNDELLKEKQVNFIMIDCILLFFSF